MKTLPQTCPICKNDFQENSGSIVYPSDHRNKAYLQRILFCSSCGLGIGDPVPTDKELYKIYHNNEYWGSGQPTISVRQQPLMYALAQARWSFIKSQISFKDQFCMTDVGAGYGYLGLVASKTKNSKLKHYSAVEADIRFHLALKETWNKWQIDSQLITVATIDQVDEKCEVVALSHILEHLRDPLNFIKSTKKILAKNGIIFIDVPYRDDQIKSNVFPHLLFFSPNNVQMLMESAGLQVVQLTVWGTHREIFPLNKNAPKTIRLQCAFYSRLFQFLPLNFFLGLFAAKYGVNEQNKNGVWIRAVARYV